MANRRRSVAQIFSVPVIIALVISFGLISALLGDGIWDATSWIALAFPFIVIGFFLFKPESD